MANDIRIGMKGAPVLKLQERLAELGYEVGKVDGDFGPKTFAAVREYQEDKGLTVDGIAGLKTLTRMFPELVETYKPPVRHKVIELTDLQVVQRALAHIGAPIKYHLEYPNGGTDPESNMACDEHTNFLDCSGFTAYCQGYDRDFKDGLSKTLDGWDGYSNTDSKIAEAVAEGKVYSLLKEPEAGCIIVGESFKRGSKKVIGHEGIVVEVNKFASRGLEGVAVVHCSPSNYKYGESAIFKTNAKLWANYPNLHFLKFNREYVLGRLKQKM